MRCICSDDVRVIRSLKVIFSGIHYAEVYAIIVLNTFVMTKSNIILTEFYFLTMYFIFQYYIFLKEDKFLFSYIPI